MRLVLDKLQKRIKSVVQTCIASTGEVNHERR